MANFDILVTINWQTFETLYLKVADNNALDLDPTLILQASILIHCTVFRDFFIDKSFSETFHWSGYLRDFSFTKLLKQFPFTKVWKQPNKIQGLIENKNEQILGTFHWHNKRYFLGIFQQLSNDWNFSGTLTYSCTASCSV